MSFAFLSHNSLDKPEVEALAHALLDAGVRPWLDKWDLVPGRPWMDGIEKALDEAQAVLVCVGRHGLGSVQRGESQGALDLALRDESRLVIPVLLPGAGDDALPVILRQRTWIDLRSDGDEELLRLVATLGEHTVEPPPPVDDKPPYQGLAPFDERDAPRYFGREDAAAAVLERLRQGERLLTLLGASGAGKSSLLLAGLLPAVRTGEIDGSYDWTVLRMRPGPRPVHELAVRLLKLRGRESTEGLSELKEAVLAEPSTFSDEVDLALVASEDEGTTTRLLLAVDQLEEVFTLTEGSAERRAFLAAVLHAATVPGGRVTAVLTLRADFLGRALEHSRELAEAIDTSQRIVLPMAAPQLRRAVERPAFKARLSFEDGLVDTLVHEVEGQPGDLPLLQFTLDLLWRERDGRRLSWDVYRWIGELRGAIARRADEVLDGFDEDQRALVRKVFGRLVHLGDGGEASADTRRRVARSELEGGAPGSGPLVDTLIAERLLTAHDDGVEVAHEALIREWETLRAWIEEDSEGLRVQQEVARAAVRWEGEGRHDEDLWRGGRLARADEMLRSGRLELTPVEREFVSAAEDAERRVQRQKIRRLRWSLAAALVFVVVTGVLAVVALRERSVAERRLKDAVEAADKILLTIDRRLSTKVGAVEVRRELLVGVYDLLEKLRASGAAEDVGVQKNLLVQHRQRGIGRGVARLCGVQSYVE